MKFSTYWISLKSSLWFVPGIIVVASIVLGFAIVEVDTRYSFELEQRWPLFFGVGAEGARSILETIAAAMIGVAGVSFSITIVALSLAANQYTPRVLRNFMRDRGNQVVLGVLVGIFVYCLIVLRTVHSEESDFTPIFATAVAIVLALLGLGVFIYFIHHVASTIQVSTMLAHIAEETVQAVKNLFPEELGEGKEELEGSRQERDLSENQPTTCIHSQKTGYIQNVDSEALMKFAVKYDVVLKLQHTIGNFVKKEALLLEVIGSMPEKDCNRELRSMFGINSFRTIEQDPAFGIRQIVDIALKGLSAGINDPTTAINCIDYLDYILRVVVRRRIPSPFRQKDGVVRVIAPGPTFERLLELIVHEIRVQTKEHFFVALRLLQMLKEAAAASEMESRQRMIWEQAQYLVAELEPHVRIAPDRERINAEVMATAVEVGEHIARPGTRPVLTPNGIGFA